MFLAFCEEQQLRNLFHAQLLINNNYYAIVALQSFKRAIMISLFLLGWRVINIILFTVSADDGKLLAKLPKVKVLRNEQREG